MSLHTGTPVEHAAEAPLDEGRLQLMSNGDLDTLFRSSPAGHLTPGVHNGTVLLFPGSRLCQVIARILYLVAWQGKVVDRAGAGLVNRITPLSLRFIKAHVGTGVSWVDDRPCVVLDYSKTSFVARTVRDEMRPVAPGLYLGVVWLRRRRVAWFTLRPAQQL
jgi:hypothetical protein